MFSFPLWPQLFWFSKQQFFQRLHSFKGSQLGSDLLAGQSVYSFYSMLLTCSLYQWKKTNSHNSKKTKKKNNKNRKLHVRGKSEEQALPDSVSKCIIENNLWGNIKIPNSYIFSWLDIYWFTKSLSSNLCKCCSKLPTHLKQSTGAKQVTWELSINKMVTKPLKLAHKHLISCYIWPNKSH